MKTLRKLGMSLMAFLMTTALLSASAQADWKIENTFHIGGEGGWDYVTVDAATHRIFVTRTTHTMVLDSDSGKVLGDIPGQKIAHGVAIAPELNRGFITDGGGSGAIVIFDLKTYSVLGRLTALPDADGIIYDPGTDLILAVAGDSQALITFHPEIDPKEGKVDKPIQLGGSPEFLAADGNGNAYVNLEDKNVVAHVDLKSRSVVARWPVTPGGHPVGMSMDRATHQLLIGCRNPQKLVVMNAENGEVKGSVPIGAGVDATAFHAGQSFASCRDGSLVIAGKKAGSFVVEQTVKTPLEARTLGLDSENFRIYLPTAEVEASTTGRPKAKLGTFMIVVVSRK